MHVNPYLIIEDEKYLIDDFKFGFRQKPNAAGVPIEVPVFEGLHVVIRGHYPGFFLERWACASNQSKLVELVLKPLVLGSGPTRVFTFFDAHLVDFTKNYSEKKNPPVEMILKITAGGVRDSFSKSEYAAPWRETFEKPCTVVTQSTTEEACVDSGAGDVVRQEEQTNENSNKKCSCNKNLTVQELKNIIIALRKSESHVYSGINKEKLFWKPNCDLPESDKTYEAFTTQLNTIFNTYEINTCIRKIHFLAQAYHETDRFRTTQEYNNNVTYAPYIGSGLMQLTWEIGYKKYKDHTGTDVITNYDLVGNDLFNVFDSAGWFWRYGKSLSQPKAGTWNAPSFGGTVGNAVATENPSCVKEIVSYGSNPTKYAIINLNILADNDWGDTISWLVNGGGNGFQERRYYLKKLKEVFRYEIACENKI